MIKNKSPFVIYLNPIFSFRKLLFVNLMLFPNAPIIFLLMFKFNLNSSYSETRIQKNVTSQFLSQHQEFSSSVPPIVLFAFSEIHLIFIRVSLYLRAIFSHFLFL